MWRRCAAAPPGGMRSSHVIAPSSYVRHSRRDPPLDGSLRGFLATPVHHALAPLHRHRRRVAVPWGPPPSPHRPCARRRRRTEAPLGMHLQSPSLSSHRIGSLQAPLSALFFSVHVAHHAREDIRKGRETVCAPKIVPAVLCCCSFFFPDQRSGLHRPAVRRRFIVDTPEGRGCR